MSGRERSVDLVLTSLMCESLPILLLTTYTKLDHGHLERHS